MKSVGKRDDVVATSHLTCELDGSLDGIGAGVAGELNSKFKRSWTQDQLFECVDKLLLGACAEVESKSNAIVRDILLKGRLHHLVVVSIV